MNDRQKKLGTAMVACMAAVVLACAVATWDGDRTTYPTLMITNESAEPLHIYTNGRKVGVVMPGSDCIKLTQVTPSMKTVIGIRGSASGWVEAPPEQLNDHPGWEMRIGPNVHAWQFDVLSLQPAERCGGKLTPSHALLGQKIDGGSGSPASLRFSGSFQETQGDTLYHYLVKGGRAIVRPTVQRFFYSLMADCVGRKGEPEDVVWVIADAIYSVTDSRWIAGLYLGSQEGQPPMIFFDNPLQHQYNLSTLTHESLHSLSHLGDGDPEFEKLRKKCEYGYEGG